MPEHKSLSALSLHPDHLLLLNLQPSSSMSQLADAIVAALAQPEGKPSHAYTTSRAFFLEDVQIDPAQSPPSQELVDELRRLRRACGAALRWEVVLHSRAAEAPLSNKQCR